MVEVKTYKNKIEVILDSPNYGIKSDLKIPIIVDTSHLLKKMIELTQN